MKKLLPLIFTCLLAVGLVSCDLSGEENFGFHQGDSLVIVGAGGPGDDPVEIPQDSTTADTTDVTSITQSYYVKAFTIDKDYSWTVEGSGQQDSVYRDGEYIDITFNNASGSDTTMTTISVDDGEYQGSLTVKAVREPNQ